MGNEIEASSGTEVVVWDPIVRIFHWTVVAAFIVAYLVEDPHVVHVWAGYVIAAMLIARVIWGLVGSKHARFSDFLYSPSTTFAYVRDLLRRKGKRYLGHSPGGGYMIVALIVMLALTGVAGLIVYGGDENAGPLAGMVTKQTAEQFEEVHEVLANITLALILVHISAVLFASFAHHENLARSMVTGKKRAE
ncbi:cytochrome b/b6 domain-containing protein [Methyloceanibacter caenitepidi]|uniref:Ni,Fe-hydrogenase I cytochrome b subunit n=1 Tax=Methyloceanibacter caenitepidi TaxID=1384459 RepID=A0A0A8JZ16_9HYPH|nr:cytochrome b/b6 domain-containing protein [Methyloceanibacter caenitepidi]BAQ16043.1 Ni,Fe-hydrogenase I cytochrome b subunit [Methyloceanibacter caenitepidi]